MSLTIEHANRLRLAVSMIVIVGLISYRDIFDVPHDTEFCIQFYNASTSTYRYCGTHNHIR
jgi:hypothetical protein